MAKRRSKKGNTKLNITSMMDMFTIILVFLLKSFSAEGQLVTPAKGLTIPTSTIESAAKRGVELTVGRKSISVEGKEIMRTQEASKTKGYMLQKLYDELSLRAEEEKKSLEEYGGGEFKGDVNIQGDLSTKYELLTKIMYTCGQSGYPNMNLVVYKKE